MKKAIGYALLLILLVPLLLAAFVYMQPSLLRLPLEKLVSLSSGLELRIKGSFQFEPSLTPRLTAEDIVLSNPEWSRPELARVKNLELAIDLSALLSGEISIPFIRVGDAQVVIEKDAQGNDNWRRHVDAESSWTNGPMRLPSIGSLTLDMIRFEVRLADQNPLLPIIEKATASLTSAGGVSANVDLRLDEKNYVLTVESDLDSLPQGSTAAFPLHANLKMDDELLRVDGHLGWPLRQADTVLDIQLNFEDLARTAALFAQSIPPLGALALNSRLLANEQRMKFEALSLSLGNSRLTGDIVLKTGGVRPRIDGQLKADRLPENLLRMDQGKRGSASGRESPLPALHLLREWDGEIELELELDTLSIDGENLTEVKLDAGLSDGILRLRLHPLPLFSRRLESVLTLDSGSEPPAYQLSIDADKVELDKLIRQITPDSSMDGGVESVQLKLKGMLGPELLGDIEFVEAHFQDLHLALPAKEHKPVMVAFTRADLVMNEKKQGLQLTADGQVNGSPVHIEANGTAEGRSRFPMKLELVSGSVRLSSSGAVSYSAGGSSYQGEIDLSAPNLQQLGHLVLQELPPIGPVTARVDLSGNSRQAELKIHSARLAGSSMQGTASLQLPEEQQIVKVDLVVDSMQLDDLISKDGKSSAAVSQTRERVIPDLAVDTSLLKKAVGLELEVKAEIKQLMEGEENLGEYLLALQLKEGVATLDGKVHSHYLSGVDFHGELSGREKRPMVKLRVAVDRLDYGGLLHAFEAADGVKGELKLELELEGRGGRLPELLAAGKGFLRVSGKDGELNYSELRLWGGTLMELLIPSKISGTEKSIINCMAAHYKLGSGKLQSEGMIVDTDVASIGGVMLIELPSERLQGVIQPKPKRASLVTLDTPINIGGTLARPKFVASSRGTLITLGKLGVGVANPLLLVPLFGTMGSSQQNPCEAVLSGTINNEKKGFPGQVGDLLTNPVKALTGNKGKTEAGKENRKEVWIPPGD